MRISDWSSDVCSSDLRDERLRRHQHRHDRHHHDAATDASRRSDEGGDRAEDDKGYRRRESDVGRNQPLDHICVEPEEEIGLQGLIARSEEHTSELQSLMRISYAVFCLQTNIPITILL